MNLFDFYKSKGINSVITEKAENSEFIAVCNGKYYISKDPNVYMPSPSLDYFPYGNSTLLSSLYLSPSICKKIDMPLVSSVLNESEETISMVQPPTFILYEYILKYIEKYSSEKLPMYKNSNKHEILLDYLMYVFLEAPYVAEIEHTPFVTRIANGNGEWGIKPIAPFYNVVLKTLFLFNDIPDEEKGFILAECLMRMYIASINVEIEQSSQYGHISRLTGNDVETYAYYVNKVNPCIGKLMCNTDSMILKYDIPLNEYLYRLLMENSPSVTKDNIWHTMLALKQYGLSTCSDRLYIWITNLILTTKIILRTFNSNGIMAFKYALNTYKDLEYIGFTTIYNSLVLGVVGDDQ